MSRALWNNTKLDIEYENSSGDVKTGTVSPLGLVQQDERTYLVCVFEGFKDVRHLALHRLRSAETLPFVADRPEDFELDTYVADRHFNFSNGEKVCLVLESDDGYLKRSKRLREERHGVPRYICFEFGRCSDGKERRTVRRQPGTEFLEDRPNQRHGAVGS